MIRVAAFGDRENADVIWLEEQLKEAGIELDWDPKRDTFPPAFLFCETNVLGLGWPDIAIYHIKRRFPLRCIFPGGSPKNDDIIDIDFRKERVESLKDLIYFLTPSQKKRFED